MSPVNEVFIQNSSGHPLPEYATIASAGLDVRAKLEDSVVLQPATPEMSKLPPTPKIALSGSQALIKFGVLQATLFLRHFSRGKAIVLLSPQSPQIPIHPFHSTVVL